MTNRRLEDLSKEELVRELKKLEAAAVRVAGQAGEPDRERLIHDLHVHQVQLEMQNRELREAQVRLEEATSRYSDLYDFAPIGYCTLDPQGVILEINLTGAALLGAVKDALLGQPFVAVAPLDRRQFLAHMRRCVEKKARVTSEIGFRAGMERPGTVQVVSDPVFNERGVPTAYRTMLVDISDIKALESRLRLLAEAGQLLAGSLEASDTIEAAARAAVPALADVCIIDVLSESGQLERKVVQFADPRKQTTPDGRLREVPPPSGSLAPQSRVIQTGEPMLLASGLAPQQGRTSYDERSADAFRAVGVRSIMVVPLKARGRSVGALTLASAESGRVYSKDDLQIAQDLAARIAVALDSARLYSDAQHAIAARDAMLALVSHDLRNPLGVILMKTALMLRGPAETDRRAASRRSMESVRRCAERMRRLIQDLLDVSSIEAGRFAIERAPLLIVAVAQEAVEELQVQATAKSLRLICDVAAVANIEIDCDRERIMQVLSNLVGNAIKFTAPGGTVSVRAELRDGAVRFSVADTGPGIPAADQPHVFDRFWQAQKTARMGSGLGLSIAKGIVEAHEGRIWVESTVGAGSTFFFSLPQARARDELSVSRATPSSASTSTEGSRHNDVGQPSKPRRVVLVVEDDADVQEVLRETLEHAGYDVATARNGAEALDYLHRELAPFLVILDLMMPVMDGWAFLDERNKDADFRSIPVIVVSGQRDVEGRVAAAHAQYIQKPILAERLFETMEQAVH